jgi:tRNA pseudouridine38-40 synthase
VHLWESAVQELTGGARRDTKGENVKRRPDNGDWRDTKRRKVVDPDNTAGIQYSKEEIDAEQKRPKRKVAVMVGYSGTGYKGMQVNNDEPTIERDLFRAFIAAGAISKANADDPRKVSLVRCARTDKGVHAAGNVISLKLIIEDEDIVPKINEALPDQIRVWGIERTNNAFSCYQGCDSRWYEYLMPSYSLLPPHPQTYLGKMVQEYAQKHGVEDDLKQRFADVETFWEDVEEKHIKPVLDSLDPKTRAKVLERMHDEAAAAGAAEEGDQKEPTPQPETVKFRDVDADPSLAPGSKQPKGRTLTPLDFALRDIKLAYVGAKRRYRICPERLVRLQEVLDLYTGTRNFHNYTVQKSPLDPSAKRHIKSFVVNPKPIIIGDTEWLSLKVHGQSFMMHQIRKMVGLASLVVRCGTPAERVTESYGKQKIAIPKAPGLGLLLERPVFESYNKKATEQLGKETIDFSKYEEKLEAFKQEHIYNRIFDVEEQEHA